MSKSKPMYSNAKKIVSANLKQLLVTSGMSQVVLSEKTSIPKTTINGYVKGTSLPTPKNSEKIAAVFNVRPERLDPRFNMFENYEIESAIERLHTDEKDLLLNVINKIQSLEKEERVLYVDKLRFAVMLLETPRFE